MRNGSNAARVTIHGLRPIELYENKPSVVCHTDGSGKQHFFLEEKFVLILAEGGPAGGADALDFKVNNSLLKVSFYDRGLPPAPRPPVEVCTGSVDILEDTEDALEEWCLSSAGAAGGRRGARPQTARVLHVLLVEEEVAAIVPYDEKATAIQVRSQTPS